MKVAFVLNPAGGVTIESMDFPENFSIEDGEYVLYKHHRRGRVLETGEFSDILTAIDAAEELRLLHGVHSS